VNGYGAVALGVLVAGVFPCMVGALCLAPWLAGRTGDRLVAAGLMYPAGATLISLTMLGLGLLGLPLDRRSIGALALLAAAVLGAVAWRALVTGGAVAGESPEPPPSGLPRPIAIGLGTLVASKIVFVFFDVVRKPIEVWDAFAVWTMRAKVWSSRQSLVLDPADPFYLGGGARTDYPPHVSLLHAWVAIGIGEWNDVLVNLPWAFYYLSAVILIYAVVRRACSSDWAMVGAVGLSGLPLFVIHATHAGYADGILAVHFLAVAALGYTADCARGRADTDRVAWLVLWVGFVLSLPLVKLEGVPLMVAGALGLAARSSGTSGGSAKRRATALAAVAVTVAVAVVFALFNQALRNYVASTELHVGALRAVLLDLFAQGNWNILWFLFWGLIAVRFRSLRGSAAGRLALVVAAPFVPFLYVLCFTDAWRFAANQTADSRLFLAVAPAAVLFVVVAMAGIWRQARRR